jgi:acyl-CoA synthetase (AMP-forming)/AMP-acid ligase II
LHAAPLTHASGALVFPILAAGGTNVLLPDFDVPTVLATIEDFEITTMFCVPTMLQRLFLCDAAKDSDLSSLRTISYAGAATPIDTLREVIFLLGPRLMQIYGLTEATHPITTLTREEHYADNPKLGSIGKLTPNCDLRIVVGIDETVGELFARGTNCMDGYWRDDVATHETIIDGWVATGDLGYQDEEGYFWVVDRKKDVIISGGFNVYSAEIEHVLMSNPIVVEAAVVGIPDAAWGEAVHAVVTVLDTGAITSESLRSWCRERLAGYKTPKRISIIDGTLPKNRSGKILKSKIRASIIDAQKELL